VPGAFTASVAFVPTTLVPFDQEYVPPPVALKVIVGLVQVSTLVVGAVIEAFGTVMFCVITCDAVAVQPIEDVTVTVYVPGAVTFKVAFVPTTVVPLDHE
jgi:hypothetical protein